MKSKKSKPVQMKNKDSRDKITLKGGYVKDIMTPEEHGESIKRLSAMSRVHEDKRKKVKHKKELSRDYDSSLFIF